LLRNAYLAVARDEAHVTNYLAIQVIETAGKLPEAAKPSTPPAAGTAPITPSTGRPTNTQ
jgi:hypothetical protein